MRCLTENCKSAHCDACDSCTVHAIPTAADPSNPTSADPECIHSSKKRKRAFPEDVGAGPVRKSSRSADPSRSATPVYADDAVEVAELEAALEDHNARPVVFTWQDGGAELVAKLAIIAQVLISVMNLRCRCIT